MTSRTLDDVIEQILDRERYDNDDASQLLKCESEPRCGAAAFFGEFFLRNSFLDGAGAAAMAATPSCRPIPLATSLVGFDSGEGKRVF